ncbi:hypothetical protein L873DRAFT_1847078 [Choiromyces venosus 120613-1]|uniref:Uncharacterized protein n=1 Tax=Choiromyces venosus 120613-1 TaxID=1336337 RepID=A0A3N4J997_9PEZI|nr:hypothetical protein L873DRAFT_1847078 [Choiromyces venosus 120613-1]
MAEAGPPPLCIFPPTSQVFFFSSPHLLLTLLSSLPSSTTPPQPQPHKNHCFRIFPLKNFLLLSSVKHFQAPKLLIDTFTACIQRPVRRGFGQQALAEKQVKEVKDLSTNSSKMKQENGEREQKAEEQNELQTTNPTYATTHPHAVTLSLSPTAQRVLSSSPSRSLKLSYESDSSLSEPNNEVGGCDSSPPCSDKQSSPEQDASLSNETQAEHQVLMGKSTAGLKEEALRATEAGRYEARIVTRSQSTSQVVQAQERMEGEAAQERWKVAVAKVEQRVADKKVAAAGKPPDIAGMWGVRIPGTKLALTAKTAAIAAHPRIKELIEELVALAAADQPAPINGGEDDRSGDIKRGKPSGI